MTTNAPTCRGAAVLQPAAASRSLLARAPTTPHLAQHTAHAAHCVPRFARSTLRATRSPHTRTQNHERPDAPRRRGPLQPVTSRTRLRLARRPHRAVRSTPRARNTPRTRPRAPLALTHAQTPPRELRRAARSTLPAHRRLALASSLRGNRTAQFAAHHVPAHYAPSPHHSRAHTAVRNTPRTQPGAPFALTHAHTQPRAPRRARYSKLPAHHRLALASSSRADRTAQCAAHHARSSLRAVCSSHARTHNHAKHATHATQCATSAHKQCARQAPHTTALAKRPTALAKRPRAATREPLARSVTAHALPAPEGVDTLIDRTGCGASLAPYFSARPHTRPWTRRLDGRPPSSHCCSPLVAAIQARVARARSALRHARGGSTLSRRSPRRPSPPARNAAHLLRRASLRGHTPVVATARWPPAVKSLLLAARRGDACARCSRPLGRPPRSRRLDT